MGSLEGENKTKMAFSLPLDDVGEELTWIRRERAIKEQTLSILHEICLAF